MKTIEMLNTLAKNHNLTAVFVQPSGLDGGEYVVHMTEDGEIYAFFNGKMTELELNVNEDWEIVEQSATW